MPTAVTPTGSEEEEEEEEEDDDDEAACVLLLVGTKRLPKGMLLYMPGDALTRDSMMDCSDVPLVVARVAVEAAPLAWLSVL